MTLTNLKNRKLERGFTIVELLIVIVVIAILAALVLTAYNGVQQRARDSSRQSDVRSVATAAEAYASENGGTYPDLTALQSFTTVKLDSTVSGKLQTTPPPDGTTNRDKYQYIRCDQTTPDVDGVGAQIKWWKEEGGGAVETRNVGKTGTGTNCT